MSTPIDWNRVAEIEAKAAEMLGLDHGDRGEWVAADVAWLIEQLRQARSVANSVAEAVRFEAAIVRPGNEMHDEFNRTHTANALAAAADRLNREIVNLPSSTHQPPSRP